MAIAVTGVEHVQLVQRPRLLSDNRACFISHELIYNFLTSLHRRRYILNVIRRGYFLNGAALLPKVE